MLMDFIKLNMDDKLLTKKKCAIIRILYLNTFSKYTFIQVKGTIKQTLSALFLRNSFVLNIQEISFKCFLR